MDYTDQEQEFLDDFNASSEEDRGRILRLTQRLANKPAGLQLSEEQLRYMFDHDCDIPLH